MNIAFHWEKYAENRICIDFVVGWKTGSRGVGVGNGEQGVGSEYQLFFLRRLLKR